MLVEFKLPDLGENIDSGDVVKILVAVGDTITAEQPLLELETGKAVVEVPSTQSGRVAAVLVEEGDKVSVGQTVFSIETDPSAALTAPPAKPAATPAPKAVVAPAAPTPPAVATETVEIPAAPAARRVARELGVDLSRLRGTGPDGLITEDDVRGSAQKPRGEEMPSTIVGRPLPDFTKFGPVERRPMSNVRLVTAQNMAHAWTTVPQVTQYDSADITDLEVLRKRYAEKVEAAGGKLTITAILLKVVASALRQFPHFNTSVDMAARTIIQKDYVHVGIAVDTERGLLVPVIRNADQKNILELAVELAKQGDKAHKRQLTQPELEGGTFTITNLGTVGGTHFTPIVNWPEVAILGISRAAMEPVWRNNQFEPRLQLQLSLSYDHRVIDGADGARFLRWICEALEQPFFLALEG
jgi:pyruvate dehydrogenase E2 component (dihydrolipoamide acetyltransferase)